MISKRKSINNKELANYISNQLNHFFPDNSPVDTSSLEVYIDLAEERLFHCFKSLPKKYFNEGGHVVFNHLHSDQYCMYLFILANFVYKHNKNEALATKLYYLNKVLHSVDIYFTNELPSVFLFVHPLGTIIGRAAFSDYFIIYQGCTVGCLNEGIFPVFKGKTIMYANSSVLGKCIIGNNVCIAAGVSVINTDIPDNTTVLGIYPNYQFVKNSKDIFERPPFFYTS